MKNLCIFPPPFIFHSWGSALPILPPFLVRLQALISFPFERAFEPSTIKGSAFPILPPFERAFEPSSYLYSSAPSSPRLISIRARLRALVLFLFKRAFEPSTIKGSAFPIIPQFEHAFEPSSYFFSSVPSSPRPSKVVHFLSYLLLSAPPSPHFLRVFIYWIMCLRALSCLIKKKILVFFLWAGNPLQWPSGQVTHYNIPSGQVTHYNVTIWAGNPLQYTNWAGNPLQCDHLGR